MKWEIVIADKRTGAFDLVRLQVPGGWLVKAVGENEVSMCFMPDGNHVWTISKQ